MASTHPASVGGPSAKVRLNLSKRQQSGLINLSAGTTACALHQQVEAQILNLDCKLQKGPIHIFETEPLQEIG